MFIYPLRAFVALIILLSVSSVYAHNKVVVITLGGDDAPAPIEYTIGDPGPAGGIVFHVTNGGLNGLEAALVDQGTAPWNCYDKDVTSVVNLATSGDLDPNSGAVNTPLIAVQCPGTATNAAVLAAVYVWPNGQTDGFLPNKEELDLLYDQKVADVVGGFADGGYWSSSQASANLAWVQFFVSGDQPEFPKTDTYGVRAVRAF
jgi:hypothetical protein